MATAITTTRAAEAAKAAKAAKVAKASSKVAMVASPLAGIKEAGDVDNSKTMNS